nr:MAG TPA: hypothetical protein [Caudoviricetes sp.]
MILAFSTPLLPSSLFSLPFCSFSYFDIICRLLSCKDISTIAYIRPFFLCTNIKHPFCAICAADYMGNVHKPRLLLLSNQPKLLKIVEFRRQQW